MARAPPNSCSSGACRFALIDARSERSFVQRADAIGVALRACSRRIEGFNISIGKPVALTDVPLGERHDCAQRHRMTARTLSPLRRCAVNVAAAFAPAAAARRARGNARGRSTGQRSAIARRRRVGGAFLSHDAARRARPSAPSAGCRLASSGSSTRSPISASRAGSCGRSAFCSWLSPRCRRLLPRVPQLRAGARDGARRLSVPGDRRAGPVRHHRQAHDRPGAAAGDRAVSILSRSARSTGAPAYASLPSGHATTAFAALVAFGTLWPRARAVMLDLCAADRGQPRRGDGALSERRAGRRAWSAIVGALMVRRWFALRRLGFSIGPDGSRHALCRARRCERIKAVARALLAE